MKHESRLTRLVLVGTVLLAFAGVAALTLVSSAPVRAQHDVALGTLVVGQVSARPAIAQPASDLLLQTAQWGEWKYRGGNVTSAPSVASWGQNRLDLFARGGDNSMIHRWWDGSTWSEWESLGGNLRSSPSCVSRGFNLVSCFALQNGSDGVWHLYWDGAEWNGWQDLGGGGTSAPTVSTWSSSRLDIFMRGNDNALYHKWWDGRGWYGWESLGGVLTSAPSCISALLNRIDCFGRGTNNHLWQNAWNGRSWSGWIDLGGDIASAPSAAAQGPGQISVFARGANASMFQKNGNGLVWGEWADLGGGISSAPGCVSWGLAVLIALPKAAPTPPLALIVGYFIGSMAGCRSERRMSDERRKTNDEGCLAPGLRNEGSGTKATPNAER